MLTWMHHCSVLQFPYPHWVWNSFWESLHILDSFQAKLRSHVRTRLTFLLWPQAWFASWSRLSPSLSLSRLVFKKIIPLSPSLSLSRLVLKKIIPLSMLSHGFELWHDSQYQISRGWAPPKWTPPSPKNWRQNTGNNAIFPDLGGSIWQGLNQGEIYKLSRFLSRFIKIIVYNL